MNPLVRNVPRVTMHSKPEAGAVGGAIEAASRFDRETALWRPSFLSPDQAINMHKPLLDARGKDLATNDGYASGAIAIHKDSIVGAQFRLNAKPAYKVIGYSDAWADEFQQAVEERFALAADSPNCWLDASRMNSFTAMVRLQVGVFVMTGEMLATAEWIRESDRPFNTAVQMVSPDRLCNPDGAPDSRFLRRGVEKDARGKPTAYNFRTTYPTEMYAGDLYGWNRVPATKPWGRRQVIHILEQQHPDQSRGVAAMVSVLKRMRMLKRFGEVTLQNAVINASFAAAIESELPSEVVAAAMGSGSAANPADGIMQYVGSYLGALDSFTNGGTNNTIDGAKVPHLFPGTKLALKTLGTPGGVGTDFEASLLRHVAAGLDVSYEELAKDYSKVSYSSARASITNTNRSMQARKKFGADRFGGEIYLLWLEEQINAGALPTPAGVSPAKMIAKFYEPMMREAFSRCSFIGTGRGQIDELKETQAAMLRIDAGISTHEIECARLGVDFREVFEQRSREVKLLEQLGITVSTNAARQLGGASDQGNSPDGEQPAKDEEAAA
jgi:lambda family phage portal protein